MTQKDSGANKFFNLVSLTGIDRDDSKRFYEVYEKLSNIVKQRVEEGLNDPQEIKNYFKELGCEVLSGNFNAYNHSCISIRKDKVNINLSWELEEGRLNISTRKSVYISMPSELAEKTVIIGFLP